jgi:hypothetical protein
MSAARIAFASSAGNGLDNALLIGLKDRAKVSLPLRGRALARSMRRVVFVAELVTLWFRN